MSKPNKLVGLIAEDESDIEALKELIRRSTGKPNLGFKTFIGQGCGKIKRKSDDWARQLKERGCKILILVHDLDRNNHEKLYKMILSNLEPFVINDSFICIPTEEMEAWFLADSKGVKNALNLPKEIKTYHHPEKVESPKEVLGSEIEKASNKEKIYINTKHNAMIAKVVDISILRNRCSSFELLYNFAVAKI